MVLPARAWSAFLLHLPNPLADSHPLPRHLASFASPQVRHSLGCNRDYHCCRHYILLGKAFLALSGRTAGPPRAHIQVLGFEESTAVIFNEVMRLRSARSFSNLGKIGPEKRLIGMWLGDAWPCKIFHTPIRTLSPTKHGAVPLHCKSCSRVCAPVRHGPSLAYSHFMQLGMKQTIQRQIS